MKDYASANFRILFRKMGIISDTALVVLPYLSSLYYNRYIAQFYSPEITLANSSVLLMSAGFTGFIRGIHYWAAQAVFISVILHLSRIYITGSYKRPREFNWLVGVALFAITIGFIFSGTILKWDQEAYEAFLHNIELANLLGSLGTWFSAAFSSHILHRMYDIHIAVLPLLFWCSLSMYF